MSAIEIAMTNETKVEQAKDKMVKAEKKLREYFLLSAFNLEKEKQLSDAVKCAQQEYVNQLESLCPCFPD
jgi:hypothetical protein